MSFCQIEIRLVQVPHVLSLLCDQKTPWWIQPALPGDRQWCLSTKEWILRAIKKHSLTTPSLVTELNKNLSVPAHFYKMENCLLCSKEAPLRGNPTRCLVVKILKIAYSSQDTRAFAYQHNAQHKELCISHKQIQHHTCHTTKLTTIPI